IVKGRMNIPLLYIFIVLFRAASGDTLPPGKQGQAAPYEQTDPVAERMLLYQRENGGWPQPGGDPIAYQKELTPTQQTTIRKDRKKRDTTIDDDATTREIRYLAHAFAQTANPKYREAAERGVDYLLK